MGNRLSHGNEGLATRSNEPRDAQWQLLWSPQNHLIVLEPNERYPSGYQTMKNPLESLQTTIVMGVILTIIMVILVEMIGSTPAAG